VTAHHATKRTRPVSSKTARLVTGSAMDPAASPVRGDHGRHRDLVRPGRHQPATSAATGCSEEVNPGTVVTLTETAVDGWKLQQLGRRMAGTARTVASHDRTDTVFASFHACARLTVTGPAATRLRDCNTLPPRLRDMRAADGVAIQRVLHGDCSISRPTAAPPDPTRDGESADRGGGSAAVRPLHLVGGVHQFTLDSRVAPADRAE